MSAFVYKSAIIFEVHQSVSAVGNLSWGIVSAWWFASLFAAKQIPAVEEFVKFVVFWPECKWAVIGIAVTSCNLIDCCLLKCQTSSNPTVSLKMLTFTSFKYW